ncbi:MAG TPA: S8 family serine peptidase, partial [Pirellulales bacterium]|nr:S8 family serine peptidase [Pirellulales bacterium]
LARGTYGVTGAGIKIGILSDSFNDLGGEGTDIADGDLPAGGVTILREGPSGDTDEGRAMAELIHRIAPGAQLYFATADFGENTFASDIEALKAAGCQIIVDDVSYLDEPFYQDGGIVQNAIHTVASEGVSYFTSAGNEGHEFYESAFRPISVRLPNSSAPSVVHDFGGGNPFQSITIQPGATALFILQWAQPFLDIGAGSHPALTDLAMQLYNSNNIMVAAGEQLLQDPLEPVVGIEYTNNTANTNFRLDIIDENGVAPSLMKYISFDRGVTINDPNAGIGSGTVFGHALNGDANTVGAVDWADTPSFGISPPMIEPFSSIGPGEILFDANGNPISSPLVTNKVNFAAPDGSSTSVFDPFFGTSAAAPDAAAVAALMLQANANLDH